LRQYFIIHVLYGNLAWIVFSEEIKWILSSYFDIVLCFPFILEIVCILVLGMFSFPSILDSDLKNILE
jgi:hypothetical protein